MNEHDSVLKHVSEVNHAINHAATSIAVLTVGVDREPLNSSQRNYIEGALYYIDKDIRSLKDMLELWGVEVPRRTKKGTVQSDAPSRGDNAT